MLWSEHRLREVPNGPANTRHRPGITALPQRPIPIRAILAYRPSRVIAHPANVAALTTAGNVSGKPRTTFVRAYRDRDKAYLVSIGGEHALWLKNIRANPKVTLRFRQVTLTGIARDPHDDGERQAIRDAFCGTVRPFDYAENMFHRKGLPTRSKIIELHTAWLEGGTPVIVDAH